MCVFMCVHTYVCLCLRVSVFKCSFSNLLKKYFFLFHIVFIFIYIESFSSFIQQFLGLLLQVFFIFTRFVTSLGIIMHFFLKFLYFIYKNEIYSILFKYNSYNFTKFRNIFCVIVCCGLEVRLLIVLGSSSIFF